VFRSEKVRICAEYEWRAQNVPADFYALTKPANLFFYQQRIRALLDLLSDEGMIPLVGKKILDVGCGVGQYLIDLESWGARRRDLAGIDLLESRVFYTRSRLCASQSEIERADIRVGDASNLPWPDETFDIVHQSTMISSILDKKMKKAVTSEMLRVLKPTGVILWYDLLFNNPKNPNVRGIGAQEIRLLFSNCSIRLKRITLAPPIARRLVPITWIGSMFLEKLVFLNTHYLGIIRKLKK
jgi:ubiquinone/menaquinone biosynthesis C-methylase UbiE